MLTETDIQSFRRVKTARASGRQASAILCQVVWVDAIVTVRMPSTSLNRDCRTPSNRRHFAGSRSRRFRCSGIVK